MPSFLIAFALLALAPNAHALIISFQDLSFDPATPLTFANGDNFDVDFQVGGLSAAPDASVGSFDIDFAFNPSALQITTITVDPNNGLGTSASDFATASSFNNGAGTANIVDTSFETPTNLDGIQSNPIYIPGRLTFAALADSSVEPGNLGFTINNLDDSSGNTITAIPEPGTMAVAILGLVGLLGVYARRRPIEDNA